MPQITPQNLQFLKKFAKNNNREWFAENKPDYETALSNTKKFTKALEQKMREVDNIEKSKLYRIYRDVRFSKDKSPYKTSWSCGFSRATKQLRGGYYLSIAPNNDSLVGGGFYSPNPSDLKLIRDKIVQDDTPFREVLNSKIFKETFGELQGSQLKTAPKGYDKNHPAVDLLRYKNMYIFKKFTDKEVTSSKFIDRVMQTYAAVRPFFDLMSDVLTTDLNGESLYE